MADPKLSLERQVIYQEAAIRTIAQWLSQEHSCFNLEVIENILNGKEQSEEPKEE